MSRIQNNLKTIKQKKKTTPEKIEKKIEFEQMVLKANDSGKKHEKKRKKKEKSNMKVQ